MRQAENLEHGGDFGASRGHDFNGFVTSWLQENLPPFYTEVSVVKLASRLRADARLTGIDISILERLDPLAIERTILAALTRH